MLESGSQVQNAIYLAGGAEWPVCARGLGGARRASSSSRGRSTTSPAAPARRRRSGRTARRSSGGGCGRGCSTGNAERDSRSRCSGCARRSPFLLAPVGVLSIVHPEAELGVARASRATGVPMILSSAASTSLEDVAAELGDAQRWFQLYWWGDRELAGSLVDRAARSRLRRDRRHARHAHPRLARPRPPQRLPAVPQRRGAGAVLQRPALPRAARRAAGGGRADRVADGARRVPEPRAHVGRPRVAARAHRAADPREGGADRPRTRGSRSSTASTGSSSRTTAAGRSTAPSRRSTRSSRCATRSARTRPC